MRFVIYKNSILASGLSMFGAALIALAVTAMFSGELGVLPGIGVIALGAGLMWLADLVSTKKAERKRRKAQQTATAASYTAPAPAPAATCAQPQQAAPAASYTAPVVQGKPVGTAATVAGIFFLLAALLGVWAEFSPYNQHFGILSLAEYAGYLLLAIGCFQMKSAHKATAFSLIGAALPLVPVAYDIFYMLRFATHISEITFVQLALAVCAFLLLLLFALCAMKPKGSGGITGVLWFLPAVLLAANLALCIMYDRSYTWMIQRFLTRPQWLPYPDMLDIFRMLHMIVGCFLAGFCFQRICRNPVAIPQAAVPYAQPLQYAQPVQPVPQPVQPEPQPQSTAPAPRQPAPDMEKQRQAYKDLLDCGILTQEEYEQKIRELTRG